MEQPQTCLFYMGFRTFLIFLSQMFDQVSLLPCTSLLTLDLPIIESYSPCFKIITTIDFFFSYVSHVSLFILLKILVQIYKIISHVLILLNNKIKYMIVFLKK
jgi:hypothetical protein